MDTLTSQDYLGIDLGTANTLLYVKGKGVIVREPSVVAYDAETGRVLAVGSGAKSMIGKTPGSIKVIHPLKGGVIADFEFCSAMLGEFIKKCTGGFSASRPRALISVPHNISELQKRAVEDTALEAGLRGVTLVEEPLCAAIGAGLPVNSPTGCMVASIGGGTTELGVVAGCGCAVSYSSRIAGDTLDNAIISYIKQEFNVAIGSASAEQIKLSIGSAHPTTDIGAVEVKGINTRTGHAAQFTLYSAEVREAITEPLSYLFDAFRTTLEMTPPELCSDVYDGGITVCGGTAMLNGLDYYLSEKTGLAVRVAKNPADCVACGLGKLLSDDALRQKVSSLKSIADDDYPGEQELFGTKQ